MILNTDQIDFKRKNNITLGVKPRKSVNIDRKFDENMNEDKRDLVRASVLWEQLYDLRQRRKRCRMFVDGEQWSDKFYDPESKKYVTGEEYIRSQGRVPLVQNLIKPYLNNVQGQYRSYAMKGTVVARTREKQRSGYTMSAALDAELSYNQAEELDAQNLVEMAQSGIAISKTQWDNSKDRLKIENIVLNRFFCDSDIEDIRFNEAITFCGEFHDWKINTIVELFARTKAEETQIRSFFPINVEEFTARYDTGSSDRVDNLSFLLPNDYEKGRVFEIWKKELRWVLKVHDPIDASLQDFEGQEWQLEELNRQRYDNCVASGVPEDKMDKYMLRWYSSPANKFTVKFITAYGQRLYAAKNPYMHEEHPYTVTVNEMYDGRISIPVENVIPLQVSINRMVTQRDFIIGNSAKGLLLIPEETIPADMNINEFASQWSKANGVVLYKPRKDGAKPEQISSNSVPVGINEQISLSMQLFFQVSGITQAAQGMKADPGTPAALYAQESQNSAINIKNFMSRFTIHKRERDYKAIQLIQQYRNDQYYIAIAGRDIPQEDRVYDPSKIKSVKFDYTISESQDTPVFRQGMEQELMKLLLGNFIDPKMYAELSTQPWADKLLDMYNKKEQQQTPEQMQQLAGQIQEQANQNVNPKAAPMLQQLAQG